jgi:hypothetical protein
VFYLFYLNRYQPACATCGEGSVPRDSAGIHYWIKGRADMVASAINEPRLVPVPVFEYQFMVIYIRFSRESCVYSFAACLL